MALGCISIQTLAQQGAAMSPPSSPPSLETGGLLPADGEILSRALQSGTIYLSSCPDLNGWECVSGDFLVYGPGLNVTLCAQLCLTGTPSKPYGYTGDGSCYCSATPCIPSCFQEAPGWETAVASYSAPAPLCPLLRGPPAGSGPVPPPQPTSEPAEVCECKYGWGEGQRRGSILDPSPLVYIARFQYLTSRQRTSTHNTQAPFKLVATDSVCGPEVLLPSSRSLGADSSHDGGGRDDGAEGSGGDTAIMALAWTPQTCFDACNAHLGFPLTFMINIYPDSSVSGGNVCTCCRSCQNWRSLPGAQLFGACGIDDPGPSNPIKVVAKLSRGRVPSCVAMGITGAANRARDRTIWWIVDV